MIDTLLRTAVVAVGAYVSLVVILRLAGKRSMSKWNAFDSVVTIALGSSLATAVLSRQTSFTQAAVAFVMLIGLQFALTWLSVRIAAVDHVVKGSPRLLFKNGEFRRSAMRRERVPESEVLAAIRSQGISDIREVAAVVLETDGEFSVLTEQAPDETSALRDVADD